MAAGASRKEGGLSGLLGVLSILSAMRNPAGGPEGGSRSSARRGASTVRAKAPSELPCEGADRKGCARTEPEIGLGKGHGAEAKAKRLVDLSALIADVDSSTSRRGPGPSENKSRERREWKRYVARSRTPRSPDGDSSTSNRSLFPAPRAPPSPGQRNTSSHRPFVRGPRRSTLSLAARGFPPGEAKASGYEYLWKNLKRASVRRMLGGDIGRSATSRRWHRSGGIRERNDREDLGDGGSTDAGVSTPFEPAASPQEWGIGLGGDSAGRASR
ncbi:hypothetical protein KM043_008906 [Ampulex compressa]|nr:hypothetical protein KM043_008906 [Ampulex compressa]